MNEYEKACKEWLKGCTDSKSGRPETCQECTNGLFRRIKQLAKDEGYKHFDSNVIRIS